MRTSEDRGVPYEQLPLLFLGPFRYSIRSPDGGAFRKMRRERDQELEWLGYLLGHEVVSLPRRDEKMGVRVTCPAHDHLFVGFDTL